ncbi:hypothetical protein F2P81_013082 [Scophthalmus maximus]|uniref:Uncharacterized protein n=1 Tax=Scophthalmus maximus TaxID=52904 RepID=A0A6A4SW91_SCOMX|nr:hypothetical protein F2P81_013082 [Scophthalmus maximus]
MQCRNSKCKYRCRLARYVRKALHVLPKAEENKAALFTIPYLFISAINKDQDNIHSHTTTLDATDHHAADPGGGSPGLCNTGDTNIIRIPAHTNPQLQLNSYPGASLYHFLKICEKDYTQPIHQHCHPVSRHQQQGPRPKTNFDQTAEGTP